MSLDALLSEPPGPELAGDELPDINERLVAPETRYEIWDGKVVYVPPAEPPHGELHVQLAALIEAHTGPEFQVAADLLTRTSRIDDVAPDVSVYPAAPNPETDGRQIEQLAFEIVSTQALGNAGRKAAKLAGRGVRRLFAIDVQGSRMLEWSTARGAWDELDSASAIDDPALAVPLPIEAVLRHGKADDAVARALLARHNAVLEAARQRERADGVADGARRGKAEALIVLLGARGIAVDAASRARIAGERDAGRLDRWIARAATCVAIGELFDEA